MKLNQLISRKILILNLMVLVQASISSDDLYGYQSTNPEFRKIYYGKNRVLDEKTIKYTLQTMFDERLVTKTTFEVLCFGYQKYVIGVDHAKKKRLELQILICMLPKNLRKNKNVVKLAKILDKTANNYSKMIYIVKKGFIEMKLEESPIFIDEILRLHSVEIDEFEKEEWQYEKFRNNDFGLNETVKKKIKEYFKVYCNHAEDYFFVKNEYDKSCKKLSNDYSGSDEYMKITEKVLQEYIFIEKTQAEFYLMFLFVTMEGLDILRDPDYFNKILF